MHKSIYPKVWTSNGMSSSHWRAGRGIEFFITENVPIRMRVNFAPKRIEFTTGYRIDATKWGYIAIADDIKANAMSKFNQL